MSENKEDEKNNENSRTLHSVLEIIRKELYDNMIRGYHGSI